MKDFPYLQLCILKLVVTTYILRGITCNINILHDVNNSQQQIDKFTTTIQNKLKIYKNNLLITWH